MIRLRPSGADEVLIKRVQDWYEPGPGVFIQSLTASFSPAMLFTGSTTGAWYDPSDTTTLYRDAAGTQPVTAVEQPVGLIKDKSGRNNHAFNSSGNSANFPVLSARYNLLTKTEDFSDADWTKSNATVTANVTTAPDGTLTGDKLVLSAGTYLSSTSPVGCYKTLIGVSTPNSYSVYVKAAEYGFIQFRQTAAGGHTFNVNLSTGLVNVVNAGSTTQTVSAVAVGNGWIRVLIENHSGTNIRWEMRPIGTNTTDYTVDGTSGVYIWGADLRVSNDGVNQPAYQRVNTSTDYDTVGFKPYLRFNGTNQWLQTNSIDFTYGDKMFVCAGVRKLSDAATATFIESSAAADTNAGAFYFRVPVSGFAAYDFVSRGTAIAEAKTAIANYPAPITNVVSGVSNISAPSAALRINGSQVDLSTATQGTGNYGNYPLYIGARAGSSLWFNGRLYGMVVAGKQASAAEITSTETYLNQKTGAF